MEWDRGAPWYRPTRVNHVPAGAELGWRSGWAKWPEYYLDSLPAAVNIGPGSPTGVEFYDHYAFPAKYHGAMFGCDWATGRIYAITFERTAPRSSASREVFLEGRPLNATDMRRRARRRPVLLHRRPRHRRRRLPRSLHRQGRSAELADMGSGIERALRQPQLEADWARARIAAVKQQLGDRWAAELAAVARDAKRSIARRASAPSTC